MTGHSKNHSQRNFAGIPGHVPSELLVNFAGIRSWGNFYRHSWGAKQVFAALDHHVWWTILRWLKKRHPNARIRDLVQQYGWHVPRRKSLRWRDGSVVPTLLHTIGVGPYRLWKERGPSYA